MQITASINGQEVAASRNTPDDVWTRRAAINGLACDMFKAIADGEIQPAECPVTHRFAPGVYVREILMPAGTIIVGKIHKTSHFNEVISGECRVVTPASGDVEHFMAGDIFVSEAGVQKVVCCISDVVWRTIHLNPTNTQDMQELEKICIAEDYQELEYDQLIEECKRLCL